MGGAAAEGCGASCWQASAGPAAAAQLHIYVGYRPLPPSSLTHARTHTHTCTHARSLVEPRPHEPLLPAPARPTPAWRCRSSSGASLVEVNEVAALLPLRLHDDLRKPVAPVHLGGQVGAARHEGVAKLQGRGRGRAGGGSEAGAFVRGAGVGGDGGEAGEVCRSGRGGDRLAGRA